MKKYFSRIMIVLLFLSGLSLLLYPTFSDIWNKYRNEQLITKYEEAVNTLPDDHYEALWQKAKQYNAQHKVNHIVDAFREEKEEEWSRSYDTILDPNGDGLMGSIEIPKIGVKLAIYHGLSKEVLEKGCGHVEGSSLPIGGKGTHAALAAHRGLPSAKLFTDLDQMEEGDIFILNILGKKLAYEVDQIKIVLPEEVQELDVVEGKDYVTLVTCTPYGVNTHRLLVRGKRTKYVEEIENQPVAAGTENAAEVDPEIVLLAGLGVFLASVIILYFINKKKEGGQKMSRKKTKKNGIKRFLVFLTVLSMLFGMSQTVSAGLYEPDRKGSFTLTLREDEKGTEQKVFPGIGMRLYKVGSVKNNSGAISFVIDSALQSTGINFDNLTTADASVKAANVLANAVKDSKIAFQEAVSNANGVATFGNLDLGMYLIVKSVGNSEIKISPILLSLPYMEDADTWLYDVDAYPKVETSRNNDNPSSQKNFKTPSSGTRYDTTPARSTVHTTTTSSTASAVKTGDDTPIAVWIGVLAVAAVAIGAMILRKKKKE